MNNCLLLHHPEPIAGIPGRYCLLSGLNAVYFWRTPTWDSLQ